MLARLDGLLSAAQLAGVDTTLFTLQRSLPRVPCDPDSAALLHRCDAVLSSHTSAAGIDAMRGLDESTVRRTCEKTVSLLTSKGLSALVEDDVAGLHFYVPNFPRACRVVRRGASEPVNHDPAVHGRFIGTLFFRPLLSTLFPILCRATPASFCVDPAPASTFTGYGSLDTLRAFGAAHKGLRKTAADKTTVQGMASAACELRPNILAVNLGRDGCLVGGTDQRTYVPVYLTVANFATPFAGLADTSGLFAMYLPFADPGGLSKAQQSLCRRLLNQEVLDVFYETLAAHRAGILWELQPGDVLLLVPMCKLRPADHPQRQADLLCKSTAQSDVPCMFCTVGRCGVCSTLAESRKDFREMVAAARVLPFSAGGAAPAGAPSRADLERHARWLGVTPTGRAPAPLEKGWQVTLPGWACKNGGGPDSLHAVRGQMRGATRAMLARLLRPADSPFRGEALAQRVRRLRPFSGAWSQLLLPSELQVVDAAAHGKEKRVGAKIATKRFASLLLLLPALVEGCDDEDWAMVTQACLLLVRVDHVMKQEELSVADLGVLDLLCRAAVRALRKFPELRRTIKVHLLLHLASFVPDCGPGNATDVKLLESLHRTMKGLRARVRPAVGERLDNSRLPAMLRRAKLVDGVAVAAAAAAALVAAGAGASGGGGAGAGAGGGAGAGVAGGAAQALLPVHRPQALDASDAMALGGALGGALAAAGGRGGKHGGKSN